jgi:hypothetical protein
MHTHWTVPAPEADADFECCRRDFMDMATEPQGWRLKLALGFFQGHVDCGSAGSP